MDERIKSLKTITQPLPSETARPEPISPEVYSVARVHLDEETKQFMKKSSSDAGKATDAYRSICEIARSQNSHVFWVLRENGEKWYTPLINGATPFKDELEKLFPETPGNTVVLFSLAAESSLCEIGKKHDFF